MNLIRLLPINLNVNGYQFVSHRIDSNVIVIVFEDGKRHIFFLFLLLMQISTSIAKQQGVSQYLWKSKHCQWMAFFFLNEHAFHYTTCTIFQMPSTYEMTSISCKFMKNGFSCEFNILRNFNWKFFKTRYFI